MHPIMGSLREFGSSVSSLLESSQAVLNLEMFLSFTDVLDDDMDWWMCTLLYPAFSAGASVIVLFSQLIFRSTSARRLYARFSTSETSAESSDASLNEPHEPSFKHHVTQLGGPFSFSLKLLRLASCLALLALSIFTLVSDEREDTTEFEINPKWITVGMCGTYAYASFLALISVASKAGLSKLVTHHLVFVLLVAWGVYLYRDVWPLATFALTPLDEAEGAILWAKVSVLTFAAACIPLVMPAQYSPVDPKDPMPEPNPEQTASILAMATYTWLDPIIFFAYRVPHLAFEQLPPLADYDYAKNLVKRSFPHLDPFQAKSDRHIFFGIMRVFRKDYIGLAILLVIRIAALFASPLGINRLLAYLETDGENAIVRPWVWISWLFLGPVLSAVAFQWYIFIATRMMVQMQGIITELIFDHALRIRVKAETSDASASSRLTTAVPSPDNASTTEPERQGNRSHGSQDDSIGSEEGTLRASTAIEANLAKGKQSSKQEKATAEDATKSANLVGKINNLVTTDLNNITDGRDFLFIVLYVPVQVALCVWFLYAILGWSAFTGMGTMVLLFPLPGYIASLIQNVQVEKMKKTDARVETVTETMSVIRMVKLFGWEPRVADQLVEKREDELLFLWKYKMLELLNGNINYVIPIITMIVTFVTYTIIMKQELTASRVFSSMAVFDMLRDQLHFMFGMFPAIIQAKVSLDRVSEFLRKTELLDIYAVEKDTRSSGLVLPQVEVSNEIIGVREASFTWSNENDGTLTPGPQRRSFTLRIEDELLFKRGHINLIVGPTGSGKTSLLMALLGEMHYIPSGPESFVSLPRSGGIAYAAQESWVQNETIRDNILFGAPFDEERYNKVIEQCALERDLSLFDAGDKTEVGEKGLTLSGGQKARITLARAVYSSAEILLLDDVLAALDVHTARWIVDKCFKGDLIQGRTMLLVTHNVAMASPIADFVVALGTDGRILSQGSLSKVLEKDEKLSAELVQESEEIRKAEHVVDQPEIEVSEKKADGKLVVAEEISEGHVGWPAMKLLFASLGGSKSFLFWFCFVGSLFLCSFIVTIETFWLGYWAEQYEDHNPAEVKVPYYLTVYVLLMLSSVTLYCIGSLLYVYGSLRASRSIHKHLVTSVLSTTLRWLDVTPTSRIIARCTQDIQAIDGPLSNYLSWIADLSTAMLLKFFAVVYMAPFFAFPGVVVAAVGGWCGQVYIKAQLSVKREMSNARAPVLGHFGAAITGLTSIRAYGAQDAFRKESYHRVDRYTRTARTSYNLNRWVSIRIEALGALFAAGLASYLVYGGGARASDTGFSLNMAVGFSGMILWWIRILNEFEVSANSLERIQQYLEIEQEEKPTRDGIPPAYWPASGSLRVEKLAARYSQDGPEVLHDISFEVKSGERVGIVGRTGSGKSSLTLSLLRCIFTEGKVYYDGLATDTINLDALRSNITIIPQVPELLSGSLRQNLDPFSQHDDAVLNDALRAAGLFSLQSEADEGRITLDSQISSGGGNLSVGQRQVLALARAIVRQSKLLILDEATSAIDYETDTVIQTSLRRELGKDVTLLTIAHRLQTIMDADKIMVLDAGRIVEFDTPRELLKNEKGMFRTLVDESGDKEALYAMAAGASGS